MFRGANLILVAVGVLMCPFHCMGGSGSSTVSSLVGSCPLQEPPACHCGCSGGEEDAPAPANQPCERECVCKVLVDGASKLVLSLAACWSPLEANLLPTASITISGSPLAASTSLRSGTQAGLLSGMAIRVAFESLLL